MCADDKGPKKINATPHKDALMRTARQEHCCHFEMQVLLRWRDTLEAQLHQTRTLGAHLLDSTLHHLAA